MFRSFVVIAACTAALSAQSPAASSEPPSFVVAAIKPSTTGGNGWGTHTSKGEVIMNNISLKNCVEMAYDKRDFSYEGPAWMESARFDINAKPPQPWDSKTQFGPMLLTLLKERFKLEAHMEEKVMPAYALVLGKGGIKVKPVENPDGGASQNTNNSHYKGTTVSMKVFADWLQRQLNQPVVDKTGLTTSYNIEFDFAREDIRPNPERPNAEQPADNGLPSLFTVVQSLGLKLSSEKLPIQIVVVDHMEKVPTEN